MSRARTRKDSRNPLGGKREPNLHGYVYPFRPCKESHKGGFAISKRSARAGE